MMEEETETDVSARHADKYSVNLVNIPMLHHCFIYVHNYSTLEGCHASPQRNSFKVWHFGAAKVVLLNVASLNVRLINPPPYLLNPGVAFRLIKVIIIFFFFLFS